MNWYNHSKQSITKLFRAVHAHTVSRLANTKVVSNSLTFPWPWKNIFFTDFSLTTGYPGVSVMSTNTEIANSTLLHKMTKKIVSKMDSQWLWISSLTQDSESCDIIWHQRLLSTLFHVIAYLLSLQHWAIIWTNVDSTATEQTSMKSY